MKPSGEFSKKEVLVSKRSRVQLMIREAPFSQRCHACDLTDS